MALTRAFLIGADIAPPLPAIVCIGVEGKQRWHRDTMPTLKKAIQAHVGHKVAWRDIFIWGLDVADGDPAREVALFNK